MRLVGALVVGCTACVALGAEPTLVDVVLNVRVCEGPKFKVFMNRQTEGKTCETPVAGVPLSMKAEERDAHSKEVITGKDGRAKLGPLALQDKEGFRVLMACTTHMCMTLRGLAVNDEIVKPGVNELLIYTVPRPQPRAEPSAR